ncbi:MAG: Eco57I restriction-modification methylase domain-containing protein, partial [Candidatus Brocadiae bacterium]|nr:Eco57I restriction-modification methylase domain-containing protein [Candidatus Brocadiia bacterium]
MRHYRTAQKLLEPYRSLLDVWVSHWFGNEDALNAFRLYPDQVDKAVKAAIRSGGRDEDRPDGVSEDVWEVVIDALSIAQTRRFFHWELEFPEVHHRGGQGQGCGFDAVVGNPPYDVLAEKELGYDISDEMAFFRSQAVYEPSFRGKNNLYKLFICRGRQLVAPSGMFSFIVPMALLGDDQAANVRRMLLEHMCLQLVEAFPQKDNPRRRVFPEAKLSMAVFVACAEHVDRPLQIRTHPGRYVEHSSPVLCVTPGDLLVFDLANAVIPSCTQKDWDIAVSILGGNRMRRLGDYIVAYQGEVNETTDGRKGFVSSDPAVGPQILRGATVCMYALREASQGTPIYLRKRSYLDGKPNSEKARHHKQCRIGWQESCPQNNFRRVIAAPIPRGEFCNHKINYVPEAAAQVSLDSLLALLNSKLLDWYFRLGSTSASVSHYQ